MAKREGMLKVVIIFLLIVSPLLFSGYGARFAGGTDGYEVGPDSVKADFDISYDRAFDDSLHVAKGIIGRIDMSDKSAGLIKSESKGNNVVIHIVKLTEKKVEIIVSARIYTAPRVQYARNILAKISRKLR